MLKPFDEQRLSTTFHAIVKDGARKTLQAIFQDDASIPKVEFNRRIRTYFKTVKYPLAMIYPGELFIKESLKSQLMKEDADNYTLLI
jgi:hypothetical protein